MPLGEGTQSGIRVVIVRDTGISHRYGRNFHLIRLGYLPESGRGVSSER